VHDIRAHQALFLKDRDMAFKFLQEFLDRISYRSCRTPHSIAALGFRSYLSVESLEDRRLLAVTANFSATDGTLSIFGDSTNNTVEVSRTVAGDILVNGGAVNVLGETPTVANTAVIQVFGLGGDDFLTLNEANGALPRAKLFGGTGNDTLIGGSRGDQLYGQLGDDDLRGQGGVDFLFGGAGNDELTAGAGNDQVFGETGDDLMVWNPGDGSDRVEGRAGRDALILNGSNAAEAFAFSSNGNRLRLTRDIDNIVMDVSGVEEVNLNAGGQSDLVSIDDLSATEVTTVNLNPGSADGQGDTIIINGTNGDDVFQIASFDGGSWVAVASALFPFVNIVGAQSANDHLVINALGGNDGVDAGSLAANAIGLVLNGGAGNDELLAGGGDDLVNGGAGDDRIFLESGDDTFVWNPGDGNDIVEGMAGRDALLFNGSNDPENITISANGGRVRFSRDVANVTLNLGGVEQIEFNALGGADKVVVDDLSGTDVDEINLNLAGALDGGAGDGQVDSVVVNGTSGADLIPVLGNSGGILVNGDFLTPRGLPYFMLIRSVDATDTLHVNGNDGDDRIEAEGLDTAVAFSADGGDGNDRLVGSPGDDILSGGFGDDELIGGPGLDILDGGPGNNITTQ
jgi:Ca2+-binding RTX toxin-like protein